MEREFVGIYFVMIIMEKDFSKLISVDGFSRVTVMKVGNPALDSLKKTRDIPSNRISDKSNNFPSRAFACFLRVVYISNGCA